MEEDFGEELEKRGCNGIKGNIAGIMDNGKASKDREKRKFYYIIAVGGQITFLLVGPVVFCLLIGLWLDSYFHTAPLFIIIGVIAGFVGSIFNVFRVMKIIDKM